MRRVSKLPEIPEIALRFPHLDRLRGVWESLQGEIQNKLTEICVKGIKYKSIN